MCVRACCDHQQGGRRRLRGGLRLRALVELEQRGHHVVVRREFSDTPAATKLMPGAILTSVNGAHPSHVRDWQRAIRGDVGTPLELEVEYPGLGHRSVILKRDLIHLRVR